MVRIVATSDFHGQLPNIPECDVLLICGDICPDGSSILQSKWLDGPFRNWLSTVPAKEIVGVAGNHDLIFERADLLVPQGLRWHYLKDTFVELFGLKIYGTPWQLPFWGAFNLSDEKLAACFANIPVDIDILVSHAPPFCIFDEVPGPGSGEHTGSISLRNKVLELKPQLFVCGHIHCSPGITQIEDITFANVSLLNDDMKVANQPVLFDIAVKSLPLEYSTLSEYFDVLSLDGDDSKNSCIERILKEHKVETVLDLTCGTGSQILWLAKHGYKVLGADLSPALLEIARGKARKEKRDITFIEGDMRTIQVGTFDAVITIANAIGHLTKTGFEIALRNIHNNLKEGGVYIFDIFNSEAMTESVVKNLAMDLRKTLGDTAIHHVQDSQFDREQGLLTSTDQFSVQAGSNTPKVYRGKFTLQTYTAKQLQEILTRNGFEVLGQYGLDGSQFVEMSTENILTVARKCF